MTEIQQHIERVAEDLNKGIPPDGSNRFNILIALRDEAQRLITAERDAEYARNQEELKQLQAQLAAKKARIDGLDKAVAISNRAPRSDAGKPREKKAAAK